MKTDRLKIGKLTDISFYILLLLVNAEHGYSIMKKVAEMTKGQLKIGPASLYSTLKKLVNSGMIKQLDDTSFNKKTYIITKEGFESLDREYKRRKIMIEHADQLLNKEGGGQK